MEFSYFCIYSSINQFYSYICASEKCLTFGLKCVRFLIPTVILSDIDVHKILPNLIITETHILHHRKALKFFVQN